MSKLKQLLEKATQKNEMRWRVYAYDPSKDNKLVHTSKDFENIEQASAEKLELLKKNPDYTIEIVAESSQKNEDKFSREEIIADVRKANKLQPSNAKIKKILFDEKYDEVCLIVGRDYNPDEFDKMKQALAPKYGWSYFAFVKSMSNNGPTFSAESSQKNEASDNEILKDLANELTRTYEVTSGQKYSIKATYDGKNLIKVSMSRVSRNFPVKKNFLLKLNDDKIELSLNGRSLSSIYKTMNTRALAGNFERFMRDTNWGPKYELDISSKDKSIMSKLNIKPMTQNISGNYIILYYLPNKGYGINVASNGEVGWWNLNNREYSSLEEASAIAKDSYPNRQQYFVGKVESQFYAESAQANEAANIDVKNPGVLEVPDGKKVDELPQSHFEKLVDKKGYAEVIRALTNLEVWNKDKNKSLSSWASNMADKLKKKFRPESAQKNEDYKAGDIVYLDDGRKVEILDKLGKKYKVKSTAGLKHEFYVDDFRITVQESYQKNEAGSRHEEKYKNYIIRYEDLGKDCYILAGKEDRYGQYDKQVEVVAKHFDSSKSDKDNMVKAAKAIIDRGNIDFSKKFAYESAQKNESYTIQNVKTRQDAEKIIKDKCKPKDFHFTDIGIAYDGKKNIAQYMPNSKQLVIVESAQMNETRGYTVTVELGVPDNMNNRDIEDEVERLLRTSNKINVVMDVTAERK